MSKTQKKARKAKVKLKLTKQHMVASLIVVFLVAGYFAYDQYQSSTAPLTVVNIGGSDVPFRVDIVKASQVDVFPDDETLRRAIDKPPRTEDNGVIVLRPSLKSVQIAFNPDGVSQETLGYYTVEATEIIKKLTILYRGEYGVPITFSVVETHNYTELEGSNSMPVIALVHPDIADGTFVSVDEIRDVITVSGGDSLEDFDLATVKLMSVALGIEA